MTNSQKNPIIKWYYWLPLLLIIAFGIGLPFIWQAVYNKPPPESTVNMSTLLTLIIVIFGAGGLLSYLELKERLRREADNVIRSEMDKARESIDEINLVHLSRLNLMNSLTQWREYELEVEREKKLAHIDYAIQAAQLALRHSNELEPSKHWKLINSSKNHLAYHLAARYYFGERQSEDKNKARKLALEIFTKASGYKKDDPPLYYRGKLYQFVETYGWVYICCAGENEEEEQTGKKVIKELLNDLEITDDEWKEKVRQKYAKTFIIRF